MSEKTPSMTLLERWNIIRRSKLAGVLLAFALGFVGLGGWALTNALARTGVLSRFEVGRERIAQV